MNAPVIQALTMPKLGLTMKEGTVAAWHVAPGTVVTPGQRVFDVETEKVTNECEAEAAGVLRRQVASQGAVLPVGALVGVIADAAVSEAEIDRFVAGFQPEKQV
ncbi:MAG: biotin/lipoyl-containing protein [Hydrogenophaga sp.]|nr:biotin/lipoyl-containing protein [Hydrogenophaga sp.]